MNIDRYVYSEDDVPTYVPVGHSGTVNRRLIAETNVGAKNFQLVLGRLEKGGVAKRHAHPDLEQGMYVLAGRARVEMDGESREVGPGAVAYFPQGAPHQVTAVGEEPLRVLIVYSPPLKAHPG